jgi:formylglycine-generating enzyme required for sulfatase activity
VGFLRFIATAWLALVCAFAPAHAEKRVALVIGNDRYANLAAHEQLQKAVNDARAIGRALTSLGFEVMSGENADRAGMVDKLDGFARRLGQGDTAFFFFSGHGVALGGANYILPTDVPNVEAGQETRLARFALSEHIVSDLQARGVRVAVVVLDACRTNPFTRPGGKGVGGERGLAPPPPAKGVFSIYAASAGQAARDRLSDDDRNPNSVFSRVLVPALTRPGLDLTALAFDVREEVARVAKSAGYVQEPSYYDGTIGGRVYLAGLPTPGNAGVPPPPAAGPAPDEVTWNFIKDNATADLLRRFIADYPASPRRREAEERLKKLEQTAKAPATEPPKPAAGQQVAVAAPPVAPATAAADLCSGQVTASFPGQCHTPLTAAQERGLKPKDAFRECADCPEMVVVPAGSFTMGPPDDEKGRRSDEGPQHVVTIGRPFAVGKLHVTVEQFAAFVRDTAYAPGSKCYANDSFNNSWRAPGFVQQGSHPVVCVTWKDAKAYVDWIAKKTGEPYRLLTEAEFEYAARGQTSPGTYPRFWFGNDEKDLCRNGNVADTSFPAAERRSFRRVVGETLPIVSCKDGFAFTSPAGHYTPNAFGLFDMAGNASQLVEDCWHENYDGAPLDGSAWLTNCYGHYRLQRGGSYYEAENASRAASRYSNDEGESRATGFRVARTLAP